MKKAVFPGSFDPITRGHVDVIKRGLDIFDEIIIAIGVNADKKCMFSLEDRMKHLEIAFKDESKITIKSYTGLTVDFCKSEKAPFILRGLRNSTDFTYEQSIAQANETLAGIESVFLICSPEVSFISSSIVRDVIRNGGDYRGMVPKGIYV